MRDEPRPFSRLPYRANAVLVRLPLLCEVTLIDISVHGALVWMKGNVEFGVGDEIRLRVLTEKGNQALEVRARVAHRSCRIVGLEISAVDHHARCSLQRLNGINPGNWGFASRTLPVLLRENSAAGSTPA